MKHCYAFNWDTKYEFPLSCSIDEEARVQVMTHRANRSDNPAVFVPVTR